VHGVTGAARAECLDGVVNRLVQIDEALRIVRRCVACLRRRTAGDVAQCAQPGGGVRIPRVRRSPGSAAWKPASANASVRSRSGDSPGNIRLLARIGRQVVSLGNRQLDVLLAIDEHAGQRRPTRD